MDKGLVDQMIETVQRVVASGAISANGHGNVSLRVPGAEEMYFTAGPSLRNHAPSAVVRVGLDGTLLEGDLPPIQGAVVAMHTAMYADHADVGCVLHTYSPFATAYAVAHRPIGCWVEAQAMFGLPNGVPVASYGPGTGWVAKGVRRALQNSSIGDFSRCRVKHEEMTFDSRGQSTRGSLCLYARLGRTGNCLLNSRTG